MRSSYLIFFSFFICFRLVAQLTDTSAQTQSNSDKKAIDLTWSTCQKLSFLLDQSHTNFQSVPVRIAPSNTNIGYVIKCNLFNESPAIITGMANDKTEKIYQTTYIDNVSLATAEKMIAGVDAQIKKCLSSDWTVETIEKHGNTIKEIDYVQKGNFAADLNDYHKKNNIQNKIVVKIEKSSQYKITVQIL